MYCKMNKIYCDMANENGYCKLSACVNPKFNVNIHPTDMIHSVGERSKAVHFKESRWHTGTPTEKGWYVCKLAGSDIYETHNFTGNNWDETLFEKWKMIEEENNVRN